MKLNLLSVLLLCSLANAIHDADILSNTKYKDNPLGNIIPGRYIIEFDESYQGSSRDFITSVQSDTMISSRIKMAVAQDFNTSPSIFKGVSVAIYDDYVSPLAKRDIQAMENTVLKKLLQSNHVKKIYPVVEIPRPNVNVVMTYKKQDDTIDPPKIDIPHTGPQLPFTHVMTQVDKVHSELGLKGKGIVVGVIDSGVDYNHPALGGGFGEGHLVRYGYDLVGNNFNSRDPFSRRTHDTPLDSCKQGTGHGTHVAGIIAANDKLFNFTGVAPEITMGAWRVFSCLGSTSNDIVIQALLDAYQAGCDIINLSLGSPSNWPDDPTALVADKIAEQGSIVVTAAGNDGEEGPFYISSPSTGLKTVSVASVDNIYNLQQVVSTEAGTQYPYTLSSTTNDFPSGKLVNYLNSTTAKFDACNGTAPDGELKDKLVLVQRGDCTFDEKAATAKRYGAKGIVVYDNIQEESFKPQTVNPEIPLSAISLEAGLALKKLLHESNYTDGVHLTFHHTLSLQNVTTGYDVSDFSSVGPLYDMSLKPDVAGPGGYIFSTLPIINGGYGILSGTSMAAPYISGAYALYLEKHGRNHDVDYLREHFQNYAKPSHLLKDYFIDNPIRQGAGLLQLLDSIDQSVHVSPGSISFNDTDNRKPQSILITNPLSETVQYRIHHLPAITAAPYGTKGFTPLAPLHYAPNASIANLTFSLNEITLPPGETAEITIQVDSVSEHNLSYPVYGGFVQFSPVNGTLKPIRVPYIGVEGSLTQLPIFDDDYPFLMPSNATRGISQEETTTAFVLDRSDNSTAFVTSIFRLLTGTQHLITEVLDDNLTSVGVFSDVEHVPRSLTSEFGYFFTDRWNGTVTDNNNSIIELEPGNYRLNWKALKLLSDPNDPDSWETKTSPPILIKDTQF